MLENIDKKFGLIAGDGSLPVTLVQSATSKGHEVITISLAPSNKNELNKYSTKTYSCGPGELLKIGNILKKEEIKQIVFIGKVHKGLLFRNPKLDSRAIELIKMKSRLNDDEIMLTAVEELRKEGIEVLDQTLFIKHLLAPKGLIGNIKPTKEQLEDIEYGFKIAKEIGRLDIGQTVVVENRMLMAIEAIEGTDQAIKRGCKLGKGNGVVVKVSKPNQDQRFDIPTIGYRTLKTMARYKAKVLAVEANETFIVDREKLVDYADKHNIVLIAV